MEIYYHKLFQCRMCIIYLLLIFKKIKSNGFNDKNSFYYLQYYFTRYILFALAKLGKTLGHYKLVRIAYKKLNNLRLPDKLSESIQIGSIEIRTKPFVDAEELSLFCYRCSSQYSLINGKLNRCVNCDHRFIHSFYSFGLFVWYSMKKID